MPKKQRSTRKNAALTCAGIAIAATCSFLMLGCSSGMTFTASPTPIPTPTPAVAQAVVLSTNPSGNGSNLHINVSDDSTAGTLITGPNPLFLGKVSGLPFVLNSDNTVTIYTSLAAQYTPASQSTLITTTLPGTISGEIMGAGGENGGFYTMDSGTNDVTFIGSQLHTASQVIPVGARPVAAAFSAKAGKLYVVNHDDNTVTVMGAADNAVLRTIPVGAQPIWATASADGLVVYVVNQGDGTVSAIDTSRDEVICAPAPSPCPSTLGVPNAALSSMFAFFDPKRQRLYVTNPGTNTIRVIDGSSVNLNVTPPVPPNILADIPVSGSPISVVALSDGSRVYAALGNCLAGTNNTNLLANLTSCTGNLVSVIDTAGLKETKTITVGVGAVSVDAAADASRVYVANANDQNISIIKTSSDTESSRVPAPAQNLSCSNPASCPSNLNQTPFMVRVVP